MTVQLNQSAIDNIEKMAVDGAEEYMRGAAGPLSQKYCPKLTTTLVGSYTVKREGKSVSIGYGGAASAYATKQYYDASLNHDEGEMDHWIERAIWETISQLPEIVNGRFGGTGLKILTEVDVSEMTIPIIGKPPGINK